MIKDLYWLTCYVGSWNDLYVRLEISMLSNVTWIFCLIWLFIHWAQKLGPESGPSLNNHSFVTPASFNRLSSPRSFPGFLITLPLIGFQDCNIYKYLFISLLTCFVKIYWSMYILPRFMSALVPHTNNEPIDLSLARNQ